MPNLIVIFGPPAVGKMSVGQALAEITAYKLFHNHTSIEAVLPVFDYGSPPFRRLVKNFRQQVFSEVAASDLPGLIFTWVWAFDLANDKNYIDEVAQIFIDQGGQCLFVGLEAPLETLIERNAQPERLAQKPSKRNLTQSSQNLQETVNRHNLRAPEPFYYPERFCRLDNSQLSPAEAALAICQFFQLPYKNSD